MAEVVVQVGHEAGLHARPLAAFVKVAKQFQSNIQVENVTSGRGPANGKSPLKLMLLAVQCGHEIRIRADGPDSEQALAQLEALVAGNFAEEGAA